MKKTLLFLLVFCLSVAVTTGASHAHELATAGTISVALHIEPDDHVVSGQPSPFAVEFVDSAGTFKPSNCDCKLTARHTGTVVATASAQAVSDEKSTGSITFPKPGMYVVSLEGSPKQGATFASFDLQFPVTVTKPATGLAAHKTVFAGGVVGLLAVALGLVVRRVKFSKRSN